VILGYRDKRTRDFAVGRRVKAFDGIARRAELKLDQLDAAVSIVDLMLPVIDFEHSRAIEKATTAFASTINGAFASRAET